jgi:hypothetical protein
VPVTFTERLVLDAALAGLRDVMVGTGFGTAIVKGRELDGPPPGEGFETVTWAVPGLAKAEGLQRPNAEDRRLLRHSVKVQNRGRSEV